MSLASWGRTAPAAQSPGRRALTSFQFSLGPYDSDDAVGTLPGQLELLRTLRDLGRPSVRLAYCLRTEGASTPETDLEARFEVRCLGTDEDQLVVDELEDIARVVFVDGWHLGGAHRTRHPRGWATVDLVPVSDSVPPAITPDWAPLVDILRRLAYEVEIEVTCAFRDRGPADAVPDPPAIEDAVRDGAERRAAEFFANVANAIDTSQEFGLGLRLRVSSSQPVGDAILSLIGRMVLGVATTPVLPSRSRRARHLVLHPEVAIRVFHPPLGHIQGRGLVGVRSLAIPTKFQLPELVGSSLGLATAQGRRGDRQAEVRLSDRDRLKHVYIVGKTGAGKTNLLMAVARQDIESGRGVLVIDPHGSLVDYLTGHLGGREAETVLLDFSDPHALPVLNPLLTDVDAPGEQQHAVDELIDLLIGRTFNQFTGPVFESTLRAALDTVLTDELREVCTPSAIAGVELIRQDQLHAVLEDCLRERHPDLSAEWKTWKSLNPSGRAETQRWATSKLNDFGPGSALRLVTSGRSTISIDEVVRRRGVLLIKLPDAVLGSRAANFLGGLVFSRIRRSLMRSPDPAVPFYAFIDEFQRFVRDDIEELVAEARKFGLGLVLAHQNIRQLNAFSTYEGTANARLAEAIFSNVGTIVAMKTSGADASLLANEFGVSERAIRRIGQYEALVRCVIAGEERPPFTLHAEFAEARAGNRGQSQTLRRRMASEGVVRRRTKLEHEVTRDLRRLAAWGRPALQQAGQRVAPLGNFFDERRGTGRPTKGVSTRATTRRTKRRDNS